MTSSVRPAPSAISVSTSQAWDDDGAGPVSTFAVQVGTSPQVSRVVISTAGYESWLVVNEGCPPEYGAFRDCAFDRGNIFSVENSTSWINIGLNELNLAENLGYEGNGLFGYDTVELGYPASGGPRLQKQVVAGIAAPDFWLGQFGINPAPSNFTTLNDPQPSFLWSLVNQSVIPSTTWGYTAGAYYRNNKVQGSLTLGGFDNARFDTKNITFPFYDDVAMTFVVQLRSITYAAAGLSTTTASTTLMSTPISMSIDSTIPYIYLPQEACDRFADAFGLKWNATTEIYTLNTTAYQRLQSTKPTFTFTIANSSGQTLDINLPYEAFDKTASFPVLPGLSETAKFFPLKRAANDTQYTLGRPFLQETYLIADYDRREFTTAPCVWPSSFTQDIKSIRPPGDVIISITTETPIGAIIGGVVGGVVVIGLIFCALWICVWKPRRKSASGHYSEHGSTHERLHEGAPAFYKAELDVPHSSANLQDHKRPEHHQLEMDGQHRWETEAALRGDDRWINHAEMEDKHTPRFELPASGPLRVELGLSESRGAASGTRQ